MRSQRQLKWIEWLTSRAPALAPQAALLSGRERLRVSVGALFGIFVTGFGTALLARSDSTLPVLIAPMAASAVLVFVLPASPLAQPWAVVAGNIVSALAGVTCARWIAPPLLASALAVAAAIAAMLALRCVHPPSAAVALTAVLGGPALRAAGYDLVWFPVALNSLLLVAAATLFHRVTGHRYPHHAQASAAPAPQLHARPFSDEDLAAALRENDEILDIDIEDLMLLVQRAERHAAQRAAPVLREVSQGARRRA